MTEGSRAVRALSAGALLGRPVRWRGIRTGTVADVLLDRPGRRAVGLEVECEDGRRRFLALTACAVRPREVELETPLALLDPGMLAFYREHCASLRRLVGAPVSNRGRAEGTLIDLAFVGAGRVVSAAVRDGGEQRELPAGSLELGADVRPD